MAIATPVWSVTKWAAALLLGTAAAGTLVYTYHPAPAQTIPVGVGMSEGAQPDATEEGASLHAESVEDTMPAPGRLAVAVDGAVRTPGLYRFDEGKRVQDLLDEADGPLDSADLSDINPAARLLDGTTLTVPEKTSLQHANGGLVLRDGHAAVSNPPSYTRSQWSAPAVSTTAAPRSESPVAAQPKAAQTGNGGLVDLNTASQAELEALPGIGPKTAEKIIAYRQQSPFQTVDDLDQIPGIGAKKLEALRPMITVQK